KSGMGNREWGIGVAVRPPPGHPFSSLHRSRYRAALRGGKRGWNVGAVGDRGRSPFPRFPIPDCPFPIAHSRFQSTLTPLIPHAARSPAAPGRSLVIRETTSAGSVTGGLSRYRPKNTR